VQEQRARDQAAQNRRALPLEPLQDRQTDRTKLVDQRQQALLPGQQALPVRQQPDRAAWLPGHRMDQRRQPVQ